MSDSKISRFVQIGGTASAAIAASTAGAVAQDIAGPYVGVGVATTLSSDVYGLGDDYSVAGGANIFAGFNFVSGDWVFGGELVHWGERDIDDGGYGNFSIDSQTDVRARVGKVFGRTLIYGAVGATRSDATVYGSSDDLSGINFGIGVEVPLGERGFFGGEITRHNLELDGTYKFLSKDLNMTSASIRLGLRF